MRPHLVLSEGQIQERFKNIPKRRKKEELLSSRKITPEFADFERFVDFLIFQELKTLYLVKFDL